MAKKKKRNQKQEPEQATPARRDPPAEDVEGIDEVEGELLEHLPPEARAEAIAQLHELHISARRWSGPLPDPRDLERYDAILPGLADRVVAQWERQSTHRQGIEKDVVGSNIANERRGQWLAFAIFVLGLLFAFGLFWIDQPWFGLAAFLADAIGLAKVYLGATSKSQAELQQKADTVGADEVSREALESPQGQTREEDQRAKR